MAVIGADEQVSQEEALEVNRILLAERMGWTLDYIDTLTDYDLHRLWTILEATDKASSWKAKQGGQNEPTGR